MYLKKYRRNIFCTNYLLAMNLVNMFKLSFMKYTIILAFIFIMSSCGNNQSSNSGSADSSSVKTNTGVSGTSDSGNAATSGSQNMNSSGDTSRPDTIPKGIGRDDTTKQHR